MPVVRRPAVDEELVLVRAVGAQAGRDDAAIGNLALILLDLEDQRAGAVAEEDAGAAIGPVEDTREGLGADHQHAFGEPALEVEIGGGDRVDEAGADGLHVEGEAVPHAEPALYVDGGGGKRIVRRRGRDHDQVDVVRRQAGIRERCARSRLAERSRRLALVRYVTLADAGALDDPFVGCLDDAFEIGILHDAAGQGGADPAHD